MAEPGPTPQPLPRRPPCAGAGACGCHPSGSCRSSPRRSAATCSGRPRSTSARPSRSALPTAPTSPRAPSWSIAASRSAPCSRSSSTAASSTSTCMARLHKPAAGLAREGSQFWIVEPRVSVGQVTGLDTLLSGSYIQVAPGSGAETTQLRRPRQSAGAEPGPRRSRGLSGVRRRRVAGDRARRSATAASTSATIAAVDAAAGRLAGPARGRDRARACVSGADQLGVLAHQRRALRPAAAGSQDRHQLGREPDPRRRRVRDPGAVGRAGRRRTRCSSCSTSRRPAP